MAVTSIGRRAWRDLGGDEGALDLVADPAPAVGLPARLRAGELMGDAVALASLAIQQVQIARGQRRAPRAVRPDGARITTSAQCERHFLVDGVAPDVWAPLSGFWRAADGWVRTHGNYPHHALRLATLLDVAPDAPKDAVADAVARWPAVALETAAAEAGAIVGAVRSPQQWAGHAESAAVATAPLVDVRTEAGTGRRAGWTDDADAPLAGIRVLDLTRVLAGPVATRALAFAGADVLRVDSPRLPELGWQHLETGHGKRSTTLDLADARDRGVFEELLARADVVVTGYRPASLDRFGLAPDALWERHPGLVVGSVAAWSTTGPWAARRGFDSIVQAISGIAMVESPDGVRPGALPAQVLDHSAGHLLAAAVCVALDAQRRDGHGRAARVGLARVAQELLDAGPAGEGADTASPPPTLQTGETAAGRVTTAVPPVAYPGGPLEYPALASPWGRDAAAWR